MRCVCSFFGFMAMVMTACLGVLVLSAPLSAPLYAEEPRFFSILNDIPLMSGMYELTEEGLVFDKPEGRIVQSSAVSETQDLQKIRKFYAETLPQLGWAMKNDGKTSKEAETYIRNGEILTLRTEKRHQLKVLHLSLSPGN